MASPTHGSIIHYIWNPVQPMMQYSIWTMLVFALYVFIHLEPDEDLVVSKWFVLLKPANESLCSRSQPSVLGKRKANSTIITQPASCENPSEIADGLQLRHNILLHENPLTTPPCTHNIIISMLDVVKRCWCKDHVTETKEILVNK